MANGLTDLDTVGDGCCGQTVQHTRVNGVMVSLPTLESLLTRTEMCTQALGPRIRCTVQVRFSTNRDQFMSGSGSLADDMVLETKDGQMALSILVNMLKVKRREQALSKLVTGLSIQVNG